MIKAVLFDLDGTLVNSLADLADSVNHALSQFGFPIHKTEEFKYFAGDGIPMMIYRALPESARDDETRNKMLKIFTDYYKVHFVDKTEAYGGIRDLIRSLKQKGIKTAVVSNKAHPMAVKVIDTVFEKGSFDAVQGISEEFPPKPNPKLTEYVIKSLGVASDECILLGDSGMDMAAAGNTGCIGVGALWGFRTKDELVKNGAKATVETPMELLRIIGETEN